MSNQGNTPQRWDDLALTFDDEPDHGLRDPAIRGAWRELLAEWLPPAPASVLDIGCGTGSLSLLLAQLGYQVTGTDWSPAMIARAGEKAAAAGMPVQFFVMDAAEPSFAPGRFDVVLCRHLLWALPNPAQVLQHWTRLLAPHGRLILIEGFWHTGGGLHVGELLASLPPWMNEFETVNLSDHPALWGGQVDDERYLIAARRRPSRL